MVHGADGIDEISTTGYTKISECRDGAVNTFYLHPADVGLPKAPAGSLQGGDAHENARIIEGVLAGDRGPARDVVLLNAGAALFIAGAASSVDDGILMASRAIDRGDAKRTLERLVSISTAEEFTAGAGMTTRRSAIRDPQLAQSRRSARDDRRRDAAHRRGAAGRRSRWRRWPSAPPRCRRRAGRFQTALARHRPPQRDRRVQAAVAVARRAARRTTTRRRSPAATTSAGAAAISVLTEPTFFDGSLEHLVAVRARGGRAAAAQGLHRLRVSAARGAGGRRRRGAADRRGAAAGRADGPARPRRGGSDSTCSSRCTTRRSWRSPSTPARASSASTTATCGRSRSTSTRPRR